MKKIIVGNRGHRNESKQSKETYNHQKIDYGRSFQKIKKILIVNLKSFRECYAQQLLLAMFWVNENKICISCSNSHRKKRKEQPQRLRILLRSQKTMKYARVWINFWVEINTDFFYSNTHDKGGKSWKSEGGCNVYHVKRSHIKKDIKGWFSNMKNSINVTFHVNKVNSKIHDLKSLNLFQSNYLKSKPLSETQHSI